MAPSDSARRVGIEKVLLDLQRPREGQKGQTIKAKKAATALPLKFYYAKWVRLTILV